MQSGTANRPRETYTLPMSKGSAAAPSTSARPATLPQMSGFQPRPLQVTWETTPVADWKSTPARAIARSSREKQEFPTAEAFHLIEQVAAMHVPLLVLTGGDPLRRPDLFPVVEFAARHSVRTSLTLLPTPLLDAESIAELKARGLMRVAFWLHGSTASLHDAYWGNSGSYRRTLEAIGWCHEVQLPVQINTVMTCRHFHDVAPMIELLTRLDVILWNVFFLVPSGPDQAGELLAPSSTKKSSPNSMPPRNAFTFRSRPPRASTTSVICCSSARASRAAA